MADQIILHADEDYAELGAYLRENQVRKIFLVCGGSIRSMRINDYFEKLEAGEEIQIVQFSGFQPNPSYESVAEGVRLFRQEQCDLIAAVGGGSAMDVAKCVKLFYNMDERRNYLEQEIVPNDVKLLAAPTTAGTGSEATRYAVIYFEGKKRSVTHESCIPSAVLLDPSLLRTLPEYHRKASMLDALCHAVESFWSVNSTQESRAYSKAAIRAILANMDAYLDNEASGNAGMLAAANMAGKAINITQTTAGHAMCYCLTSRYGLAHGHAAALFTGGFLKEYEHVLPAPAGRTHEQGKGIKMNADKLANLIGSDFYTGVPDSQLKALCSYLYDEYGVSAQHVIAANEGNAVALAAGYHLATGKTPVVYLQNSGLGNIVNPVASLLNGKVYGIPCLFIVGWRGEPGVHDEPQHLFQGEITLSLLDDLDIPAFVIDKDTTEEQVQDKLDEYRGLFAQGRQAAFVIRKGGLSYGGKAVYGNPFTLTREEAVGRIAAASGDGVIVSTTGKASRELFEYREAQGMRHARDFLTVGSMGHSSSIALGIALQRPERRVWCVDGDGAVLMHMGAMALIGANRPANLIHIVLNNEAHESVGGMPTVTGRLDLPAIARACGYPGAISVETAEELDRALTEAKAGHELAFLEVKCALGARENLGRPTTTPAENKQSFIKFLRGEPT